MIPSTRVVNVHREPWRSDPTSYIYVGRAGRGHDGYFGNPFRKEDPECLAKYEKHLRERLRDHAFRARALALRGRNLGCFCVDDEGRGDCHANILAAWIDAQPEPRPPVPAGDCEPQLMSLTGNLVPMFDGQPLLLGMGGEDLFLPTFTSEAALEAFREMRVGPI